jgi:riboflavin kinase/FMN adenylyltransferase
MQRWPGLDEVPADRGASVVTVGVFDGVHRGHQHIIARAQAAAAGLGRPGSHPPMLCSVRRRVELLAGLGVSAVCILPFTYEFSQLGPDEFVRAVLVDRLHAAHVTVGEDFRFGHRAAGDVALLAELGEKYDFTAEGVPLLADAGQAITSTGIRARLDAGDVTGAARHLGRPHRVEGTVVRGHQRGRALGFPTANLETLPHTAIPADGVYAGWLIGLDADGAEAERWPAAISVGTNPTFDSRERTVEAHALDRDDLDLYGRHMAADFVTRIRGQARFESVPELVEAIGRDVARARADLAEVDLE